MVKSLKPLPFISHIPRLIPEPLKLRDLVDGSVTGGENLLGEKWEDGTKWEDSREQEAEVAVVSGLEEAVQATRVQEGTVK